MSRTFTSNPRTYVQHGSNQNRLNPSSTEIADNESNIHTLRDYEESSSGAPVDAHTPERNNPHHPNRSRGGRDNRFGRGLPRRPNRRTSPPSRVPLPRPPASPNNQFARASDSVHQLARDYDQYNNSEDSDERPQYQRPARASQSPLSHMDFSNNQNTFQPTGQSPNSQQSRPQGQSVEERAA